MNHYENSVEAQRYPQEPAPSNNNKTPFFKVILIALVLWAIIFLPGAV